jgi:drug/metabolite transporter (DMT)-like permease
MTVALAALLLGEKVRAYRWSAVVVGFLGVLVMLSPHLNVAHGPQAALGVAFALGGAITSAGSVIQTRRLMDTETNAAIVFYFSLISVVGGLLTLPWGWSPLTLGQWAALIGIGVLGGIGHLLLTESFRWAPASVIAPFDYTMLIWAFVLGYAMFGEVPMAAVFLGAAIVTAAGLFVIWRERKLGLERPRPPAAGPPVAS